MLNICIDNRMYLLSAQYSILEACKFVGIIIPRFCYHEALSIAGNCRMCLVEIDKAAKPVASCATPIFNNMEVCTSTPFVQKAREGVLEFLLLQHPLDCPLCDQAGECDLQDQYFRFGVKYSRQFFKKRAVEDKYFTPTLKTIMTRCIHCTRCIRFFSEVCNLPVLGTINRGTDTEISAYTDIPFYSELSGNAVDLCPVGALTLRFSSFRFRPWEINVYENLYSIDSGNSSVVIHFLENAVGRILSKKNREVGDSWISDKIRFCFDAAISISVRLNPYISCSMDRKQNIGPVLASSPIDINDTNSFGLIALNLLEPFKFDTMHIILSKSSSFEDFRFLKKLLFLSKTKFWAGSFFTGNLLTVDSYKSNLYLGDCFVNSFMPLTFLRSNVGFNLVKNSLSLFQYVGFLFSTNLQAENVIVNTRLQILLLNSNLKFFCFGFSPLFPLLCFGISSINCFFYLFNYKSSILFNFSKYLFFIIASNTIAARVNDLRSLFHALKQDNINMLLYFLHHFNNSEMSYYYRISSINSHALKPLKMHFRMSALAVRFKNICYFGSENTSLLSSIRRNFLVREFSGAFSEFESWNLKQDVFIAPINFLDSAASSIFSSQSFQLQPGFVHCDFCDTFVFLLRESLSIASSTCLFASCEEESKEFAGLSEAHISRFSLDSFPFTKALLHNLSTFKEKQFFLDVFVYSDLFFELLFNRNFRISSVYLPLIIEFTTYPVKGSFADGNQVSIPADKSQNLRYHSRVVRRLNFDLI